MGTLVPVYFLSFNQMNKREIAQQIRSISLEDAMADIDKLRIKRSCLSNAGLRFIDFMTFEQRLAVRGKMGLNFYDFFENWKSWKERNYINNLLVFYKNDESPNTIYKIYNLAINCVHAFRPVVALQLYDEFRPTHVIDPCAGWGGRALAASVYGAAYTGWDLNASLMSAYESMSEILGVELNIGDSLLVDFDKIKKYDMVFTSPPYYDLEQYECGKHYANDDAWDAEFYFPLFERVSAALQPGGWIVLSINEKLFTRVFNVLFGEPHVKLPLTMRSRASYAEWIYAWQK